MFRILSLDGGGIRGAFSAAFLAAIERQLGRPLTDYFDLFAGTSTGAIIAAALALGESAETVRDFYSSQATSIFRRREVSVPFWWPLAARLLRRKLPHVSLDFPWLVGTRYGAEALQDCLDRVFADRTMEAARRRLLIPAVDLTQGKVVTFKTPHLPGLFRDRALRVADVVMASASAPSYFAHKTLGQGSGYCDGGLWANNPGVCAFAEAMRIRKMCGRDVDPKFEQHDVFMLSVGTGRQPYFAKPPGQEAGLLWWGPRLADVVGVSHSQGVHFQLQYLMEDNYMRVDFDVPDGGWSLDAIDVVDELVHLGREKATQEYQRVKAKFLDAPAPANPSWFPP